MNASVVIGQPDFTSNSPNQGQGLNSPSANTVRGPFGVHVEGQKLFVADGNNSRVLIYNSIPTSNNASADVVVGQTDFVTNTTGISASKFSVAVRDVFSDGQKLYVADQSNSRVLIFNSIPTSNGASADVVVGQADFTTGTANQGGSVGANTINQVRYVSAVNGKLIISDTNNNRVLIYNSIPTSNNTSADVVVGQTGFSSSSTGITSSTLNAPRHFYDGQRLFIADLSNHRVLIYNSLPTSNGAAADVVIGQTDFITNTSGTTADKLKQPVAVYSDGQRLFVADYGNNRILVYNSIPTSNGASADLVIGQSSFSGGTANQGGSVAANTLSGVLEILQTGTKLLIVDSSNQRILIFDNVVKTPGLSLNNSPEGRDNNQIRLKGTANVDSPYTVSSVQYSVNGGGFSNATATDGSFDEMSDEFYFDFTPTSNQPKDSNGNLIDGYTVRVKAANNNADTIDRLFYFSPFDLHGPSDNATVTTNYPSFEFSVNKQRENIRDNLSKYQIQVRKGGSDSSASWETLIDDIPIDFRSVKNNRDNKQWETYGHLDTNNGVYETDKLYATYSEESSRVKVYSKINSMAGTYQWKVVAIDKAGHTQEAGNRNLYVNYRATSSNFPLAILNISGLGNPYLNTYNLSAIKDTYYISSSNPIFYGIAWTNSNVVLKLTDQECKTDCTKSYSTTANTESRYGINVPKGDLTYGKKYTANISVALEDKYNELPQFTLSIGGISNPTSSTTPETDNISVENEKSEKISPTLSPATSPTPIQINQQNEAKKRCFWFLCF